MKIAPFIWLCLLCLAQLGFAQKKTDSPAASGLVDNRTGETTSISQLVSNLNRCDVLYLGEKHDNDSGHAFQLEVIKELVKQNRPVAISTEQFERDVQGALDDYLEGRIDETLFLKASRPWKNYQQHYRPIIEFAKSNRIPVIAANIPRRIAADIASGQSTTFDAALVPRTTSAPKNAYWDKFVATMKGHVGADGTDKLDRFFASQCLKDDAMAESITDYLATNAHQDKLVVHLCGHFHSDFGLGTASRVLQRNPMLQHVVITMATPPSDDKEKSQIQSRGHYVFWASENPKPEETGESTNESAEE